MKLHLVKAEILMMLEVQPIIIEAIEVLKQELVLNGNEGKWYYKDKPFNGYSLKFYPNGTSRRKMGLL